MSRSTTADRTNYALRPLLMNVKAAHAKGWIRYSKSGVATLLHPETHGLVQVELERQFPCILPTFLSLEKALSTAANSPRLSSGESLREAFDKEYHAYLEMLSAADGETPDYGTYVYDQREHNLYLVAPERWHKLALLTSNAKLLTDPDGAMTAEQIRERLANTVVGFVGASLGSNIVEGVVREMRPRAAKLADPDYLEITNLNRLQHGSLRYLSQPKSMRLQPSNPFETLFVNKARLVAYENQLIDPYMKWHVYEEGVSPNNLNEFLLGGSGEPKLDYVVEACDDFRLKLEIRRKAREHGIVVVMASDIGHRGQAQLQDFHSDPSAQLGYKLEDHELMQRLQDCTKGDPSAMFRYAAGLLGDDFAVDEFADWANQTGEQPTSSIPQSGATALLSGAMGGKLIALHRLGHRFSGRIIVDLKRLEMHVD